MKKLTQVNIKIFKISFFSFKLSEKKKLPLRKSDLKCGVTRKFLQLRGV